MSTNGSRAPAPPALSRTQLLEWTHARYHDLLPW